jgi:hypothetical protein
LKQSQDLHAQQHQTGQIYQPDCPVVLGDEVTLLRKGERKMQEQGRLQHPGCNIGPVNDPVKAV